MRYHNKQAVTDQPITVEIVTGDTSFEYVCPAHIRSIEMIEAKCADICNSRHGELAPVSMHRFRWVATDE